MIALLVLVTVANVAALALIIMSVVDETSHGASLDGGDLFFVVTSMTLGVAALVGIGGAWLRRSWGPPLYLGVQLFSFVIVLLTGSIMPWSIVPVLLAVLLFRLAERAR
ncbi:hypothetical protein GCM10027436_13320 [Actinophytocola sediminis]